MKLGKDTMVFWLLVIVLTEILKPLLVVHTKESVAQIEKGLWGLCTKL